MLHHIRAVNHIFCVSVAGFLIQLISYMVPLCFMLNAPIGATSVSGTSAFCFGGDDKLASPADICKNANTTCSFSRRIWCRLTCPIAVGAFRANIIAAHQRLRRRGDGPSRIALI